MMAMVNNWLVVISENLILSSQELVRAASAHVVSPLGPEVQEVTGTNLGV